MIEIKDAIKEQNAEIARLIMMAMTDECCQYFCGEGYGLDDFYRMMSHLVEREDSQYSYKNTLVAMDGQRVVGVSVYIGKDHTGMDDETQAGELYLDSLAVLPAYRRQGIAQRLLIATRERAHQLHLPRVGLLVDKGNPDGEALYTKVGFVYLNDNLWGGHPMKHMVLPCQRNS